MLQPLPQVNNSFLHIGTHSVPDLCCFNSLASQYQKCSWIVRNCNFITSTVSQRWTWAWSIDGFDWFGLGPGSPGDTSAVLRSRFSASTDVNIKLLPWWLSQPSACLLWDVLKYYHMSQRILFLAADRTNGCACSQVRLSSVTYALWLNGASYLKMSEEANRKWPMGNGMVTWPMTSRDSERSMSWTQYA